MSIVKIANMQIRAMDRRIATCQSLQIFQKTAISQITLQGVAIALIAFLSRDQNCAMNALIALIAITVATYNAL